MKKNYFVLKDGQLKCSTTSFEKAQNFYNVLRDKYPYSNIIFSC